jgi:hypothetical protein
VLPLMMMPMGLVAMQMMYPIRMHEQQKRSKIHRIGPEQRGSAILDPTQ